LDLIDAYKNKLKFIEEKRGLFNLVVNKIPDELELNALKTACRYEHFNFWQFARRYLLI
jgi:hypothetical protein